MARMKKVTVRPKPSVGGTTKYVVDFHDLFGERKRLTYATKREAEEVKRGLLSQFANEQSSPGVLKRMSILDAVVMYDDLVSRGKACRKNEQNYLTRFRDFMKELGVDRVDGIAHLHLEQLQQKLRTEVSASTVNRMFSTYRHFLAKCVVWGSIAKNPTQTLGLLIAEPVERKVWTLEQATKVLEKLPKRYGDFLFAMAHGGFRNNEVRKLTWGDVDFDRDTLPAVTRKGGKGPRKRLVPMTAGLRQFLIELRERAFSEGRAGRTDVVFVNTLGNPIDNSALDKSVRKACEGLKYEKGLTPIGLRHFLVTELQDENQALEKIKSIVGHSAASKVTSNYTHLKLASLRAAMETTTQAQKLTRGG